MRKRHNRAMSNADNHIDHIEFPAQGAVELAAVKAFYGNVFGWSYTMYGNDYADTPDSVTESGINAEDPAPAPLIVIHVADLDTAYHNV